MGIDPSEVEIIGSWIIVNGRMTEDDATERISSLIRTELRHVATTKDGWAKLYRDPKDGRYWELIYPQCEMQGGGPPALRVIEPRAAKQKYQLAG